LHWIDRYLHTCKHTRLWPGRCAIAMQGQRHHVHHCIRTIGRRQCACPSLIYRIVLSTVAQRSSAIMLCRRPRSCNVPPMSNYPGLNEIAELRHTSVHLKPSLNSIASPWTSTKPCVIQLFRCRPSPRRPRRHHHRRRPPTPPRPSTGQACRSALSRSHLRAP
jgi:hypothetical protein